ncbi:uncharacterized protein L3040_007648 [Drepanopeziza brunnea f. sp. 'multigermtubi']|uniref:uncharacterized protein n=1 Tax=Drepanopeziza brunnea f. sp. 'multigermtubi' TaxID=698441 RepID=UPI00238BB88D|nr:hypothetical protein L3040_007648 [Drepanopeziza brunnea f. sp. 'multigermtubi']
MEGYNHSSTFLRASSIRKQSSEHLTANLTTPARLGIPSYPSLKPKPPAPLLSLNDNNATLPSAATKHVPMKCRFFQPSNLQPIPKLRFLSQFSKRKLRAPSQLILKLNATG